MDHNGANEKTIAKMLIALHSTLLDHRDVGTIQAPETARALSQSAKPIRLSKTCRDSAGYWGYWGFAGRWWNSMAATTPIHNPPNSRLLPSMSKADGFPRRMIQKLKKSAPIRGSSRVTKRCANLVLQKRPGRPGFWRRKIPETWGDDWTLDIFAKVVLKPGSSRSTYKSETSFSELQSMAKSAKSYIVK